MAYSFHAHQFDKEYSPRRLGNWERPRWCPSWPRPVEQRPSPKPICDENGRFLPGAKRGTSGPFGHYTGTWDLPRRITKEVADELTREPPAGRFGTWTKPRTLRSQPQVRGKAKPDEAPKSKKEEGHINRECLEETQTRLEGPHDPLEKQFVNSKENVDGFQKGNPEKQDDIFSWLKKKEPVDEQGNGPYIPGQLTDPDKRHESHELLVENAVEQIHGPQEKDDVRFWKKVAEKAQQQNVEADQQSSESMKEGRSKYSGLRDRKIAREHVKLPQVRVPSGFVFARKMHKQNLEHQPLPDTLGFRHMTKLGEHRDSDVNVKPYAIGWKGYGASGPTCCTKMRVHRPKTCDNRQTDKEHVQDRPATSGEARQASQSMSNMDLAICWDYRPLNPTEEPKPPKHIDGTNGSRAPAVFSMVHTPKEDPSSPPITNHPNPIFNKNRLGDDMHANPAPYFEKDYTKEKPKDACDVQNCPQHNPHNGRSKSSSIGRRDSGSVDKRSRSSSGRQKFDGINGCGTPSDGSRKSNSSKIQPLRNTWTDNDIEQKIHSNNLNSNNNKHQEANKKYEHRNSLESYEKTSLAQGKVHHSSPEGSHGSKNSKSTDTNNNTKHKSCLSCNGTKIPEYKPKIEYKSAFKAGNPNSVNSSQSNGTQDSKPVKIPKMRDPFAKKSYTIPTLAPPFCIWRNACNSGYPEHWRLASVYQRTYKPPEQRKKPLMSEIYL